MSGYEALRSAAAWVDLSARAKIRVTGEDRARLLHAMSTNQVQDLAPHAGVYAFFLTAVGRILADAYIYNLDDALFLDTEPETGDKLREHLDRYIIADDAYLEDETTKLAAIGIEGHRSLEAAQQVGLPVPEQRYSIAPWHNAFVARVSSTGEEGIRVFLSSHEKESFVGGLTLPVASSEEARIVRLENGKPRYGEEISERYLVQETQQMHAVHTSKGCYLGQEIVERVRSRGQVHRILKRVRIDGSVPPPPGTVLSDGERKAGEIASSAFSPALGEIVGLAYLRTDAPAQVTTLGSDSPSVVRIL